MASNKSSFSEEDFSCPVCHDIYKDPVLLACSHSFCKACLQKWWTQKGAKECPVCKRISKKKKSPPCNLVLKNLCEAFVQLQRPSKRQRTSLGSEELCRLHEEKLKLFCVECQQPACVVCRDSERHTDHRFRPIGEAALDHKAGVQKSLKSLQKKLKAFNNVKNKSEQTANHIKVQARLTERHIKERFEKLRQFLHEQEEASIAALREEEQRKSQMMKEKIEGLNRDILTLSHNIDAIEEELGAEHIAFLQNYKTTAETVRLTLQDPRPLSGALIDVTKHLGNLAFRVWYKMSGIVSYTPVILDPNTAYPGLALSADLTSVTYGHALPSLPDVPERFDHMSIVLGSEGFNSGIHAWDVEVGDNTSWRLGVLAGSDQRRGVGEGQRWCLEFYHGKHTAGSVAGSAAIDLSLKQKPKIIRVQLNMDEGRLMFIDLDAKVHLHTFTHAFTDTLFPYLFTTDNNRPLKILPVSVEEIHIVPTGTSAEIRSRDTSPHRDTSRDTRRTSVLFF